jgi:hypothetical protein
MMGYVVSDATEAKMFTVFQRLDLSVGLESEVREPAARALRN